MLVACFLNLTISLFVDETRKALEARSAFWFDCLIFATLAVAFGCILEWEPALRWLQSRSSRSLRLASAFLEKAHPWGVVVVVVSVIAEGLFEAQVSRSETAIREHDESIVFAADERLGQVMIGTSYRPIPDPQGFKNELGKLNVGELSVKSNNGDIESYFLCKGIAVVVARASIAVQDECWTVLPARAVTGVEISGDSTKASELFRTVARHIPGGTTQAPSPVGAPVAIFVGYKSPFSNVEYPKPK